MANFSGGLCPNCAHVREIVSGTGSRFLLCRLSQSDARYSKYPPQPMLKCAGSVKLGEMTIDGFFIAIDEANSRVPGVHTVHAGASLEAIDHWQSERGVRLPEKLAELLRRSNGVALHQGWHDGEPIYFEGGYRFYRLEEIVPASEAMYGAPEPDPSEPDFAWMAFGEGPDASVFFVFDKNSARFLSVEPSVPREAKDLGTELSTFFDMVSPRAVDSAANRLGETP